MRKLLSTSLLCLFALPAMAGNDNLPNGRPFQNLQDQINVINLTIAEQKLIYDAKFAQLESQDDTHDELIAAITVALSLVESRVAASEADIEALELADSLQLQLINALTTQLNNFESATNANFQTLFQQDRLLNQLIATLESRVTNLQNQANFNTSQINNLNTEIRSYRSRLTALNNLLSSFCSSGQVVTGIYSNGDPQCRNIDQVGSIYTKRITLSTTSFCDSSVLGVCVDTDYFQSGTAFCNFGDVAVGGGFSLAGFGDIGGNRYNLASYPSGSRGWFVQSIQQGDDYNGSGYVRCLNID